MPNNLVILKFQNNQIFWHIYGKCQINLKENAKIFSKLMENAKIFGKF